MIPVRPFKVYISRGLINQASYVGRINLTPTHTGLWSRGVLYSVFGGLTG